MSITKSKAFLTSDGKMFPTIEEAQKHEVEIIGDGESEQDSPATTMARTEWIVRHKSELLAILSTRKARVPKVKPAKVNKTRSAAAVAALQDAKQ